MKLRLLPFLACGLLGFAGALGLTGSPAVGQTVTLPLTTLTAPTLTIPTVTSPVPLPSTTVELPGTETVVPGGSSESGSPSASSGGAGGAGGATAAAERRHRTSRPSGERLRLTEFHVRPSRFKNEPRAGGETGTTLHFRLSDAAAVVFRVRQESPRCQDEGTFRSAGRPGANRVPFLGWMDGERLPPGTYTIRAQARRGSLTSAVRTDTFVIVPTHEEVEDARRAPSRCPRDEAAASSSSAGASSFAASAGSGSTASAGGPGDSAGEVLSATASEEADEGAAGEGAPQSSGEGAPGEAAGGGGDGDGFPGSLLEPDPSPLLLLAAILLLALLVAGNAVYGWRLRRAARTQ